MKYKIVGNIEVNDGDGDFHLEVQGILLNLSYTKEDDDLVYAIEDFEMYDEYDEDIGKIIRENKREIIKEIYKIGNRQV